MKGGDLAAKAGAQPWHGAQQDAGQHRGKAGDKALGGVALRPLQVAAGEEGAEELDGPHRNVARLCRFLSQLVLKGAQPLQHGRVVAQPGGRQLNDPLQVGLSVPVALRLHDQAG